MLRLSAQMRDTVTFFTQYNEPGGTASPPEVRALISPLINQLTSCVFTLFKEGTYVQLQEIRDGFHRRARTL